MKIEANIAQTDPVIIHGTKGVSESKPFSKKCATLAYANVWMESEEGRDCEIYTVELDHGVKARLVKAERRDQKYRNRNSDVHLAPKTIKVTAAVVKIEGKVVHYKLSKGNMFLGLAHRNGKGFSFDSHCPMCRAVEFEATMKAVKERVAAMVSSYKPTGLPDYGVDIANPPKLVLNGVVVA